MNTCHLPLVSVCIPVYRVESYIGRCLESLFEQSYNNLEYIFIDDCSPDRSIDIVKEKLLKYPYRKSQIRIIRHEENKGLGEARNTAVKEAKGSFIIHVDSDDYIDKNVISNLVIKQEETNADMVFYPKKILYVSKILCASEIFDEESPHQRLKRVILNKITGNVCGVLIRSSLYKENGIKVEYSVNQSEDFQVLPRLLYCSKKIASINDCYYYYDRTNEISYTNNLNVKSYEQILNTWKVLRSFFKEKNEQSLLELFNTGNMISLCRSKTRFAKQNNRQMYEYICYLINVFEHSLIFKLPYKYILLIRVKNFFIYKFLVSILK